MTWGVIRWLKSLFEESKVDREIREHESKNAWMNSRRECWKRGIYANGRGGFELRRDLVEPTITKAVGTPHMQAQLKKLLEMKNK